MILGGDGDFGLERFLCSIIDLLGGNWSCWLAEFDGVP
jgi:hypothetical protein